MQAIKRVRALGENEMYYPAYAGEYADSNGDRYFLSNAEAFTVAALYNLKSAELQFDFFCFAYLWTCKELIVGREKHGYQRALDRYKKLRSKFENPWYSQAKHVIPVDTLHTRPLTEDGDLDVDKIREVFDQHTKYDFILYRNVLYDDPRWDYLAEKLSVLRR